MINLIKTRYSPPGHQVTGAGSEGGVVGLVEHVGRADEVVGELRVLLFRLDHQDRRGDEELTHQRWPAFGDRRLDVSTPVWKRQSCKTCD